MRAGFLGKLSSSLLEVPDGETNQQLSSSIKLRLDSPPLRPFTGKANCLLMGNLLCCDCHTVILLFDDSPLHSQ